jgi:hypothetical protein
MLGVTKQQNGRNIFIFHKSFSYQETPKTCIKKLKPIWQMYKHECTWKFKIKLNMFVSN